MKSALLAFLLLLAVGAQADLVAEAPAGEPLAPAPAPAKVPSWDVPCPAPAVVYTSIEECDQAIAAGFDVVKAQGVSLDTLARLGVTVNTNSTVSTTISSSISFNGERRSIKYQRLLFDGLEPPLFCCGLTVETSTTGSTAVPNGMTTTSTAMPAFALRSLTAAAVLAASAAALVM